MSEKTLAYLRQHREEHLEELKDFLRIPSISALSEHRDDVRRAAEWVADCLRRAGLEHVETMATDGHPVVYGDYLHAPGKPTVLIYGHYDVQPVDPLHLWVTGPFDPAIRDGRIFARGATDDKGQTFLHFKTIEALLKTEGSLPVNIKFCVEGEEEIGSEHLPAFVEAQKERFRADAVVISDSHIIGPGKPSIVYGLRGLCALQVDVRGANTDLHSGDFGGAVPNPIHALVELLATLHAPDGRVAVEGFYDDVLPLSAQERAELAALPHEDEAYRRRLDLPALFGEPGYTTVERASARPTLEINGIYGGFQGEGTKTVIPREAHAKITCRLVNDQEPETILALLERHLQKHVSPAVHLSIRRYDSGRPFVGKLDSPALQVAAAAYEAAYGVRPLFCRMGGSIPIVDVFDRVLKTDVVLMGFGLDDENLHAPNEHFSLENFDRGLVALTHLYTHLDQI